MTGYQSKRAAAQDKLAQTQKPVAWLEPEWGEKICPEVGYEVTMTDDHPRDLCWIPLYAHPPQGEPWRESASDYERGVIDGMQKQAQSSVDKAVNRMAQRPWVDLTDEDDDTQVYKDDGDALTIAYQSGYYDGKKAAQAEAERGRERNFCERCGKRLGAADHIHTCTPPQKENT